MGYFPITLNVANKPTTVVGGGFVAERRVESLLKCDAVITVITPTVSDRLGILANEEKITLHRRAYRSGDARGALMVLAATDDSEVNALVAADARDVGILVNVADDPSRCDFIMPAVVRRGDLSVAISTGGKSPALAARLREKLSAVLGPEYGRLLDILGGLREDLRGRFEDPADRKAVHYRLVDSEALRLIREGAETGLVRCLDEIVGETPDQGGK